ncbi:MAG: contractile injection system tape measure protein [Bacteroidota bacterium]
MSQNHLIYKQILEVEFSSRKEAMDGQNRLSQLYKLDLIHQIQQIFDEMVSPHSHLRIRRLEVDLGQLSAGNFEEDLAEKFASQLRDQLYKQQQTARRTHKDDKSEHFLQKRLEGADARISSTQQSALEQFSFFIQTGRYPWWAGRTTTSSPEKLAEELMIKKPDEFIQLFETLYSSDIYGRRLIYQLPDATLEKILQLVSGNPGSAGMMRSVMRDFIRLHESSPLAPLNRVNFRLMVWRTAFDIWLKGMQHQGGDQFHVSRSNAQKSSHTIQSDQPVRSFLFHLLQRLTVNSGKQSNRNAQRQTFQKQVQFLLRRVTVAGIKDRPLGRLLISADSFTPTKWKSFLKNADDSISEKQNSGDSLQIEREQRAYSHSEFDRLDVDNAGLVLIAPFLPIFFDALGLLKEKSFITPQAAERGALILQFIATGDTEMAENELILNKILTGIHINEPLPRHLDLSNRETEEVTNLLNSVIEHWSALKGTSVRGVRDTFINREGYLVPQQNGWKLFVERITPDVLIDRLPWSISIIKLPWTKDIIHTEW